MGLGDITVTVYDIVVLHINVEYLQAHAFPYSELHQNGLSNAGQDVSSCEEEDVQVELPGGSLCILQCWRETTREICVPVKAVCMLTYTTVNLLVINA